MTHPDAEGNHQPLHPLTGAQSAHLVHLVLAAADRYELDLEYDGATALIGPGRGTGDGSGGPLVLGLTNLARLVATRPPIRWPAMVADHVEQIALRLRAGPLPAPTDPPSQLIQRLVPRSALPAAWTLSLTDFIPGLLSVPATIDDGHVNLHLKPEDFGLTWSQAEAYGLANLRRRPDIVEPLEAGGAQLTQLSGSPFTASRALVLDTVLRDALHVPSPPHGVLVALPARDHLLIHVIRDLSVIPALALLLSLTDRSYTHRPGPLSPDIHLVTDSTWTPATIPGKPFELSPTLRHLTDTLPEKCER